MNLKHIFKSNVNDKSLLLVCIFHSRYSLQSQSWFYNGPNQDSKIMAALIYQLTHWKLNQYIYFRLLDYENISHIICFFACRKKVSPV